MKNSLSKLAPLVSLIRRYALIILIVAVGAVYGYLIVTAGNLASKSPSDAKVQAAYKGTNRPKIDETVVQKLSELEDQNVQFQALLEAARNNPFAE